MAGLSCIFVTLLLIAAIMFSFNGLLFDPDIRRLQDDSAIMAVMLGIATFFILLVLTWLLQYMVRFMMSKRSREFATYLLLGMKRRQISKFSGEKAWFWVSPHFCSVPDAASFSDNSCLPVFMLL